MRIDYEIPELIEAKFGSFVQGASLPGNDNPGDPGTSDF